MDRRTFLSTSAAVAVTGAAKASPPTAGLAFRTGVPAVPKGTNRIFIVMTRREDREDKEFVFPAYYLDAFPLEYDDCICENEDDHSDGCPTSGWFYDESNFEYEHCYWAVQGEVIAWAELPSVSDVKAALALLPTT